MFKTMTGIFFYEWFSYLNTCSDDCFFHVFFSLAVVFKYASSTFSCNTRGDLIAEDIEDSQVCDFIPDCANDADESSCGK